MKDAVAGGNDLVFAARAVRSLLARSGSDSFNVGEDQRLLAAAPHGCIEKDGFEERQAERAGGEDRLSRLDSCDFGRLESRVSSPPGTCQSGFIASIGLRKAYARKRAALPVSSYVSLCGCG